MRVRYTVREKTLISTSLAQLYTLHTGLVERAVDQRQDPLAPRLGFQVERRLQQVVVPHEAVVQRQLIGRDSEVALECVGNVVGVAGVSLVKLQDEREVEILGQVDLVEDAL